MPPKRKINDNGEDTFISKFKNPAGYTKMKMINDGLKTKLENIFNNNKFD